ncbi:dual specificity tyrosine-phosphorylation-regulated kinase 2-like [Xenia sp. Carnegie-2017]|uniref:dual specificity tyrosine-phosphorylation-regulated kinase 2-like n=1 Tax=Xenia sp. Carnegie-2017 TaxID=2897299 RepID=UPI001F04C2F0|nr:dual specificity tyrosine-phosphorylation-regulated kinase 2-like [Xenia sp. Carnegie-2017]
MHSFRPPHQSRDCFQRLCVCPNPSERSIFAQMTVGLKMLYSSIDDKANKKQINKSLFLNSSFKEDKFKPVIGALLAGRYKVIANVGEGQSSVMVQAEDTYHPRQRYVAIKILHKSYANLGPQEASCLLHLRNSDAYNVSNIAHFLNMFAIGNHFCIVFKFLLPKPIYKYFQMFPFQSKMERLNSLKNSFSTSRKNVKLIDLGNAIYCVHKEMSLYFDSFELQTVFYRAPEVMFGLPFGYQIDMWSLACVLAELYLGEPLFLGTSKRKYWSKYDLQYILD